MILAEQISKDYTEVLKLIVVPAVKALYDLKLREVRLVMGLGKSREAISASELADQLRQDPSTVTRSLIILVRGGFVTTVENEADGRSKMISLTDKGQAAARLCYDSFDDFLTAIERASDTSVIRRPEGTTVDRINDIKKRAAFVLRKAKGKR